jgi:hypothetical protein
MGLAYSDLPIVQQTISANPASFLAALHSILTSAGWTWAAYLTGLVYACLSPQGLAVQVRIWDPADLDYPQCFAFQWVSSYDPYPESLVFHLRMDAGVTHSVWVNCCSIFIGRTGITHTGDQLPWSVCGGIPYAFGLVAPTEQCAAQSPAATDTTTELWFASGSDSGVAGFGAASLESFRSGHYCKRFSWCRNGAVVSLTAATEITALQLSIRRPAGYIAGKYSGFSTGILYADGTPIQDDPLVSIGGKWYGQLYDACLLSKPMALEATEQVFETVGEKLTSWINHSIGSTNVIFRPDEGSIFSLLLLTGSPTVVENVAY